MASPGASPESFTVACETRTGMVRRVNQDAVQASWIGGRLLLGIADGIGGHRTGEVASHLALDVLRRSLVRDHAIPPVALARGVARANAAIFEQASTHAANHGMGTTLTALFVDGDVAFLAHVGDSRAYLFRDGKLLRLTADHTWVADRVREGVLSRDEARDHRWRNVITNALGSGASFRLDVSHHVLHQDDRLILLTDGVTTQVAEGRIADLLRGRSAKEAVSALLDAADARGSPDNVSAVVAIAGTVREGDRRLGHVLGDSHVTSVDVGPGLRGVRSLEARYPASSPLRASLRRVRSALLRAWRHRKRYGWLLWSSGSLILLGLFIAFALRR